MLAVLIVLTGLLLRVAMVDRHSLWADEIFSLAIATGHSLEHPADRAESSLGDFVEGIRPLPPSSYARYAAHSSPPAGPARVIRAVLLSDTSPPLYYLTLWAWTRTFGTSDAALRLCSVAWWLLCLPPLAAIARRSGGRRAVLPALLLFSASPQSLYYSTEGRMYSMLLCLVLTTALLTLGLNRRGPSPWRVGAWVVVSSLGLLTHYFFVFPWSACLAWLMIHPGKSRRWTAPAAASLAALAVAPWYLHLGESLAAWRVTRDWLEMTPRGYSLPRSMARLAWSPFSSGGRIRRNAPTGLILAALAAMAVARGGPRRRTDRVRLLWCWLMASLLGPLAFDALRQTYTIDVPRYAISGLPAAYLLVAVAMSRLSPAIRLAFGAMFVVGWLPGLRAIEREDRAGEQFREIGALLAEQARPSDLVIVHSIPSGAIGVARYMDGRDASSRGVALSPWVGQLGRRRVPDDLAIMLAGRGRARLVLVHSVGEPAPEEEWLRRNATLVGENRLGSAAILDFVPVATGRFPVPGETGGRAGSPPAVITDQNQ